MVPRHFLRQDGQAREGRFLYNISARVGSLDGLGKLVRFTQVAARSGWMLGNGVDFRYEQNHIVRPTNDLER